METKLSRAMLRFIVFGVSLLFPAFVIGGCTIAYTDPPEPEVTYVADEVGPAPDADFEDLHGYGEWIAVNPFGTVWRPYVVNTWRPYAYGQWSWTDYGWTWVSYEPFGWIVYHYGRWYYEPAWGWLWIPGYEWEPVLVSWAWYEDYVCWAPLPPAGYAIPDPWYVHTPSVWVVVPSRYFLHNDLNRFTVPPSRYKETFRATERVRYKAPEAEEIARVTGQPVRPVKPEARTVNVGSREYKKLVLPYNEQKIVKQYSANTEKRAYKTKGVRTPAVQERTREDRTIDRQDKPGSSEPPAKQQPDKSKPKQEGTKKKYKG
jgi:hypothetical protein